MPNRLTHSQLASEVEQREELEVAIGQLRVELESAHVTIDANAAKATAEVDAMQRRHASTVADMEATVRQLRGDVARLQQQLAVANDANAGLQRDVRAAATQSSVRVFSRYRRHF